jgi:hypothetical protein
MATSTKLISNEEILRKYLPNAFAAVKGETSLFEKLQPFLEVAEEWVKSTFTSESTFNTIVGYADTNVIKTLTARIVVAEAFRCAIPSLDLVLTPNGFGTVGNNNVAPASKPRVDRLIGSMQSLRDDAIGLLLVDIVSASKWSNSKQAEFFGATLFPNLDIVTAAGSYSGSAWDRYLELRSKVIDIEDSLAEDFFSPELFAVLRNRNLLSTLSTNEKQVVSAIQSQIIDVLKGGNINMRKMIYIVNFIRDNADSFPEWHTSDTAKLFSPPIFRNKKESPGYFF